MKGDIMNRFSKLAANSAIALAVAMSFSASAFADWRNPEATTQLRDQERVRVEGRISNIARDREGYRVQLDRNSQWYFVPARAVRGDFRIGMNVRLGGTWRRGEVFVETLDFPIQRVYVRGTVQSVDLRNGLMYVRDEFSRRLVTIAAVRADRDSRRFDLDEVRRGDYVDVYGDWAGHGVLNAYKIEGRNTRRY
jgi:hypothetical protein